MVIWCNGSTADCRSVSRGSLPLMTVKKEPVARSTTDSLAFTTSTQMGRSSSSSLQICYFSTIYIYVKKKIEPALNFPFADGREREAGSIRGDLMNSLTYNTI